jgi:hypothetical protein
VAAALLLLACSTSSNKATPPSRTDAASDAASDAPIEPPGPRIVTVSGGPLQGAAGDAIPLQIVVGLANGTTEALPAGTPVEWIAPKTVVAQNPYDASPNSVLPPPGAAPTGIFIENPYRTDRNDYTGTLFLINAGTEPGGTVTVSATVGDAGTISATVAVAPTPSGSVDAGVYLFTNLRNCYKCHGETGNGSPPVDAGPDGAVEYLLLGTYYPFPAPGLNNTSPGGQPNLAADPAWNAALLGMSTLGDIDNNGVALRKPMPDWLGKTGLDGGPLGAQDFADMYAWLKTQKQ